MLGSILTTASLTRAADVREPCLAYGEANVVLLGVAGSPVSYRLTFDVGLSAAKQRLAEAEHALEQYRISIGDSKALTRDSLGRLHSEARSPYEMDLIRRTSDALNDVWQAEAMTSKPLDLVVTPMEVVTWFKGKTRPVVFLNGGPPVIPGRSYLIYGDYPFFGSDAVVRPIDPLDIDAATEDLRYLSSAVGSPETTIRGALRFRDPGGGRDSLGLSGIIVRAVSDTWTARRRPCPTGASYSTECRRGASGWNHSSPRL